VVLLVVWWNSGSDAKQVAAAGSEGNVGLTLDAPPGGSERGPDVPVRNPVSEPERATPQASVAKPKQAPSQPALAKSLEGAIGTWMAKASKLSKGKVNAQNTVVAVHVRDLDGRVWVDRNTSKALVPASNLKLLTCTTAVLLAEPGARFDTPFETAGTIQAGVLSGHLVARAGADPWYVDGGDGSLDRWLDPLAQALKDAGIQKVTGALVLDEGDFAQPGPAPEWPDPKDYWQEYCALSGGFSANAGCLTALLSPSAVGSEATTQIRPRGTGLVRSDARVTTVAKRKPLTVAVEARAGKLIVRGSLPADVPRYEARFAHPDPVDLFGYAVVDGLKRRGITIQGGFERRRNAPPGKSLVVISSPLLDALQPILNESNNSVADQLFLWLGHRFGGEGTRVGGAKAVRIALDTLGVTTTDWVQVDGSGLSKANRVRADQLTALLAKVLGRQDEAAWAFRRALPVAGTSGTLERRMQDGAAFRNVLAKTGWVEGASALSGLVQTKGGDQVVFSILVDYPSYPGLNPSVFKPMQDELCEILAGFQAGVQ